MNKTQFKKIFIDLVSAYPGRFDSDEKIKATCQSYYDVLSKKCDIDELKKAILECKANCKWFPTVHEILSEVYSTRPNDRSSYTPRDGKYTRPDWIKDKTVDEIMKYCIQKAKNERL